MELLDKFNAGLPDYLPEDKCWEWQGNLDKKGYGFISWWADNSRRKGIVKAHRLAYELHYAEPLGKLHCLHKCDNRRCVNPAHLYAGDHSQNMRDKVERGRQGGGGPLGVANGSTVLNEEQVKQIRKEYSDGKSVASLTKRYNISRGCCTAIVKNWTWKHLLED